MFRNYVKIAFRNSIKQKLYSFIKIFKDFLKLVVLANVIAWPVAYYAMNKWLQSFAYRINIGLWIFLLAGSLTLVIALLTVSYQAIRAATASPVEALRYE